MTTNRVIATIAAVAMIVLGLTTNLPAASAQGKNGTPDFAIGKKGEIHFNVAVKAGSVLLEPGMYEVQHAVEGTEHFIAFKAVQMPAGYRHANTRVAKEPSARISCRVEAVDKKVRNTVITLRTNAAGEK